MKRLIQNKKLLMVLAIAWTILIFIGCSLPGKDLPPISVFDHFDKVVHFTFFFVFAILWLAVLSPVQLTEERLDDLHTLSPSRKGKREGQSFRSFDMGCVGIILLSFAYGFFLEWYQINFVPGRAWDVWDGVADGAGGIVGCLFARYGVLRTKKIL